MKAPLVQVRGPRGDFIATEKTWDNILSAKGGYEYVGPATEQTAIAIPNDMDDELVQQLLKRRSRLRGKSGEGAVKLAGGDVEEARLLFQAEQHGSNREDVLAALLAFIDAADD